MVWNLCIHFINGIPENAWTCIHLFVCFVDFCDSFFYWLFLVPFKRNGLDLLPALPAPLWQARPTCWFCLILSREAAKYCTIGKESRLVPEIQTQFLQHHQSKFAHTVQCWNWSVFLLCSAMCCSVCVCSHSKQISRDITCLWFLNLEAFSSL